MSPKKNQKRNSEPEETIWGPVRNITKGEKATITITAARVDGE